MTLEELMEILKAKFVGHWDDIEITSREHGDGSSDAEARIDGKIVATWSADLIVMPPRDGITPRGPKVYHSLLFC